MQGAVHIENVSLLFFIKHTKVKNMRETENKMGIMPVNRLLVTMALPMICSMFVQAFYNVTDSIFVSRIGEHALTAVSLVFPVQNFMTAAGSGMGVGMGAVLSRALGAKKGQDADKAAGWGLILSMLCMGIFILFGIFGSRIYFTAQTGDEKILSEGILYNQICCCLSAGAFLQMYFEKLLQSTGKTFCSMVVQSAGSVVNIILDPILIFGYFHFPAMGVKGAALATVAGQTVAAVLGCCFHFFRNKEIRITAVHIKKDRELAQNILAIGVPSVIMQSLASVMVYGMNLILISFTSTATAVFGVYYKLQSFAFMPVFGLGNAMVPIVAFNYGAKRKDRIRKTLKLSLIYVTGIMVICTILFQTVPDKMLLLFNVSDHMKQLGYPALRILSCNFIFAGFSVVLSSMFQALGKSIYSMWVSVFRQLVILLPAAYLLSLTGDLTFVWWAYPIAAVASAGISLYYYHKLRFWVQKTGGM